MQNWIITWRRYNSDSSVLQLYTVCPVSGKFSQHMSEVFRGEHESHYWGHWEETLLWSWALVTGRCVLTGRRWSWLVTGHNTIQFLHLLNNTKKNESLILYYNIANIFWRTRVYCIVFLIESFKDSSKYNLKANWREKESDKPQYTGKKLFYDFLSVFHANLAFSAFEE